MSLTNQDKKWIEDKIEESGDKNFKQLVAYVDMRFYSIEKKLEHIEKIPTKEEFYEIADQILSRLNKIDKKLDKHD